MASSSYASALGRLKVLFPSFLSKESYAQLLNAKDVNEIAKQLESSPYAPELTRSRSTYQGEILLEIAVNRTFIHRNLHAYEAAGFAGRPIVAAYLKRWDIQNIELILSSKAQGRSLTETESHLVSSRDIPAGVLAGTMTLDDFRLLLGQPSLEAIASQLVRFGYGQILLPLFETYERSHNIFPLTHALDREYYRQLLESLRFFQGDEWVVRHFVQSEIDVRNLLLLLKGIDAELPFEEVGNRFLEWGTLSRNGAQDLYSARGVPELVESLLDRSPSLAEGKAAYAENRSLTGFDAALNVDRGIAEIRRMKTYPLSLAVIFTYLMLAELERADLLRLVFGRLYGLPSSTIGPLLVSPRLGS